MVSIKTTIINITLSYRCQASTLMLLEADGSEHRRVFRGQLAIVSLPTRGEFNIRKTEQNCVNCFFVEQWSNTLMIFDEYPGLFREMRTIPPWKSTYTLKMDSMLNVIVAVKIRWRIFLHFSICFAICICIWFEIVFIFVFLRAGDLNAMVVHCFESAVTHWRTRRGRTCHVLFWTQLNTLAQFWTLLNTWWLCDCSECSTWVPLYVHQEEDYLQTVCEWRDAVTVTAKVTYLHQLAETIVTTDSEEAGPRAFGKGSNALLSFE